MADSIPLQIAETVQTAHIRHNPSAEHDLAPSTSADIHEPVVLEPRSAKHRYAERPPQAPVRLDALDDEDEDDEVDDENDEDEDDEDAHYSVIRPWDPARDSGHHLALPGPDGVRSTRSHHQLPPLPDLRFEQSYLRSVATANTWWKVALITVRDQVLMPFMQGLLYNLAVGGWQYWNRSAKLSGQSLGARARRWWWGVNNWSIPGTGVLSSLATPAKRPPTRHW